jgi:MFS family permease
VPSQTTPSGRDERRPAGTAERPRSWAASARDFRLLAGAVGLSALGDWLALVALALHVEAATGSSLALAALFFALWSPAVLLAGPAGLIADRVESRALLIAAGVAAAAACGGLALASSLLAVLPLALLLGCAHAIAAPAEFALVPAVAGEARLAAANGQLESARYAGYAAGPLLGGVLAAGIGTSAAMLVDAGTFLVLAGAAVALRARRPPVPGAAHERAREGIAFLVRDGTLAVVMAVAFVSLLFMTASWTAEPSFALEVLEIGATGYGAVLTVWTLGMVVGAVGLARHVSPRACAGVALGAVALQGLGLGAPAVWLVLPFVLVATAAGGVGHGVKNVLVRTLIHERVPERLRGRAYAAYNGLRNAAELGALLIGGVLVAEVGPRWTLLMAGALPVVAAVAGLAWQRRAVGIPVPEPA